MNLTINPVNRVNHVNINRKSNKLERPVAISFQAAKIASVPKKSISLSAMLLSGLAALGLKKKTIEAPVEPVKPSLSPIEQAKQENPEFVKAFQEMRHILDSSYWRDFSDDTIAILHQENKKDPKFAYELAKYTRSYNTETIDVSETEIIADALKKQPEILAERYYPGSPKDTVYLLTKLNDEYVAEKYRELDDLGIKTGQRFNRDELNDLFPFYVTTPKAVVSLAEYQGFDGYRYFYPDDIAELAVKYADNKSVIEQFMEDSMETPYDGHDVAELLESYKKFPVLVNLLMKYGESLENIKTLVNLNKIAPDFVIMALKEGFSSDRANFVEKAESNRQYFETLKTKNPKINLNTCEIELFNSIKDEDKVHVDRIIEDNRISSVGEIFNLVPVYKRFNGRQVTDEMIKIAQDPMSKHFNI